MTSRNTHIAALVVVVAVCSAVCAVMAALFYAFLVVGVHSNWKAWAINIALLWPFIAAVIWHFRAQPALNAQPWNDVEPHDLILWAWRVVAGTNGR